MIDVSQDPTHIFRRPIYRLGCHEVERSLGALKLTIIHCRSNANGDFQSNIVFVCALLENARVRFGIPFLARVDISIEPSDVLDFISLSWQ